jgi:hypothetical protein
VVIEATPELAGKGELVVPGVPLNAPGRWKVTVGGASTDGTLGRLESEFTMPGELPEAATTTTAPPATEAATVSSAG